MPTTYELSGSITVDLPASAIAAFVNAVEQALAVQGVSLVNLELTLKALIPPPTT